MAQIEVQPNACRIYMNIFSKFYHSTIRKRTRLCVLLTEQDLLMDKMTKRSQRHKLWQFDDEIFDRLCRIPIVSELQEVRFVHSENSEMKEGVDNETDVVRSDAVDAFVERELVDVVALDQSRQSRKNFEVASQSRSQNWLQELQLPDGVLLEVDDVAKRLAYVVTKVESFRRLQRKSR